MSKYLNRYEKVMAEVKDIDRAIKESSCLQEAHEATEAGNHFMLQHIAINTAILVDMIDRLTADAVPVRVDDNDIADALIDAYMRRKGGNNDT